MVRTFAIHVYSGRRCRTIIFQREIFHIPVIIFIRHGILIKPAYGIAACSALLKRRIVSRRIIILILKREHNRVTHRKRLHGQKHLVQIRYIAVGIFCLPACDYARYSAPRYVLFKCVLYSVQIR